MGVNESDEGADDDAPPEYCGFTIDRHGGLHCQLKGTPECSNCPVALEFDAESIQP